MEQTPPPDDVRMQEIKDKIVLVRTYIAAMQEFLSQLEDAQQSNAREALRKAFEAGCAYSELKHMPIEAPFVDIDGEMILGTRLKAHIIATRKVYADIAQLHEITGQLLNDQWDYLFTTPASRHQERESGTTTINIAA